MASDDVGNGQEMATPFSWLEPHPFFCVILVGENDTAFGIQKDFLIAKSAHFRKHFSEKKEEKIEEVVHFPNTDPVVFGLAQLFMFTGTISTAPQPLPGYELMIAVWKLGHELGIDGLCEEALKVMSDYRAATNSIPSTELLVKAWNETPEGSPIRSLLLSWTAEYIRSSESRAEFTKSLPQEVLSELVVVMSHLNANPAAQSNQALASPSSTHSKNVHYLDDEVDERESKAPKHRHSEAAQNRVPKKPTARASLPPAPKTQKAKRGSINAGDDSQFSQGNKLNFCADLLNRMLSGPGFWTRLVGPFKEPVRPVDDGVPDYFEKVTNPMDLGTIKRKMDAAEYTTAEEFDADVHQIFENCYLYWGRGHEMSSAAERFQRSFEEKFGEMNKWMSKKREGSVAV